MNNKELMDLAWIALPILCLLVVMYLLLRSRLRGKEGMSAQYDAMIKVKKQELAQLSDRREEYARAVKFLEERPTLEAEQKQIELDIATKESKYKGLADDMKQIEDELKEKQGKLSLAVETLVGTEKEIAAADQVNKVLKRDNEALEATKEKLTTENNGLKETNVELKKQKGALTAEVTGLEKSKAAAEKWMNDNRAKLARMEDLDQAIVRKEKDVESLGKRLEEAQKSFDKAIECFTKMNLPGIQTLRLSSFDGLKSGDGAFVLPKENECEAAFGEGDEGSALKAAAEHFKARGFDVPARLLYAFHTSLKTSDMSSITVMAGVSGTGKSAIPKLYSEAMGIFFSPLAVEPRWDSPRDLMGFFNYVTNRYEPTPLARAMFQFQGLWDDDFVPDHKLDEYMFMPMLDEMNLARIEYYFSEFLSKLEMRRLVANGGVLRKEDVPQIGLEIFAGCHKTIDGEKVDEGAKYLFANTNTLFVGTMNEDETTQSLSDKVIDRANVLYFGKPSQLKCSEKQKEDESKKRYPLKKSVWEKWCKEVDAGALEQAREVLARLNNQLVDFNRPFAHRTFQAMLAYIANYPQVEGLDDNARINRALADQIGMRIMPKLRGLELNQNGKSLSEIGGILKELHDAKLTAAFEKAQDAEKGNGFFRWNGFDWGDEA